MQKVLIAIGVLALSGCDQPYAFPAISSSDPKRFNVGVPDVETELPSESVELPDFRGVIMHD
jgi:hypothetical protein